MSGSDVWILDVTNLHCNIRKLYTERVVRSLESNSEHQNKEETLSIQTYTKKYFDSRLHVCLAFFKNKLNLHNEVKYFFQKYKIFCSFNAKPFLFLLYIRG